MTLCFIPEIAYICQLFYLLIRTKVKSEMGKTKRRWGDNINIYLKEPVGNDPSGFIKD
jgi:hypothetical protein